MAPRRPCLGCSQLTRHGSYCRACRPRPASGRNGSTRSWRRLRRYVLARDGWTCRYCGGAADEVDHVVPLAAGGREVAANCVAACRRCNLAKGGG